MFQIQQRPNSKWRLTKDDVLMGDFDTLIEAESGMMRVIDPVIKRYTDEGQLIDG